MTAAELKSQGRPRLLFVDDEQRVLNSMRIMFRRQFDLYLAAHGAEALDIVKHKDIDVIVADHRMPQMTGVEVLTKVRSLSPRTVRILLTGYADLDAVEGSINDGEVFRFLTKPCAPDKLRETVDLAARLALETPADAGDDPVSSEESVLEIVMEGDSSHTGTGPSADANAGAAFTGTDVIEKPPPIQPQAQPAAPAAQGPSTRTQGRPHTATGLGVIVFSSDELVLSTVQQAVRGRLPVYAASNIVKVVKTLTEHRPGVLVTDISQDKATIQAMTARLKERLPELVTIAISEHRDVLDMVWLINHGQIFRFLRKPLSPGRCAISLQAALKHHRMLLRHPELMKRHEVAESEDAGLVDTMLSKLKTVRRRWAST